MVLAVVVLAVVGVVGALLAPLEAGSAAAAQPAVVRPAPTARDPWPVARPVGQGLAVAGAQELPNPPSGRRRGLPVTVAVVALVGVGSLVVRVLLAVPVRRRR